MSVLQPDPESGQPTASDLPAFQVVLQGCNPAQVDRSSSPAWRTLSRHGPRSRRVGPAERTESAVRRMVDAVGARSVLATPDGRRCWVGESLALLGGRSQLDRSP
jgi:hypothetical protein